MKAAETIPDAPETRPRNWLEAHGTRAAQREVIRRAMRERQTGKTGSDFERRGAALLAELDRRWRQGP